MLKKELTSEFFSEVYDVLIKYVNAPNSIMKRKDENAIEVDKIFFIDSHIKKNTKEYRFQGSLGFGGKYRVDRNKINCYKEDLTPDKELIIEEVNKELDKIYDKL